MENTDIFDESKYLEQGSQYFGRFLYKVNAILKTINLEADFGKHLPLHIIIKDSATKKTIAVWEADTRFINQGVRDQGSVFESIDFKTLDGKEYDLVTTNDGRFKLRHEEGSITKDLAVIFDNDEVTGIDIHTFDSNIGEEDALERVNILNRPGLYRIKIRYCKDGAERSLYFNHGGEVEPFELRLNEGDIHYTKQGDRYVTGLTIKILDDDNGIACNSDKRISAILPLDTRTAASYIKQGFSLSRTKELFAHMRKSLNEQYPGAVPLIVGKLSDVYAFFNSSEPIDKEFQELYDTSITKIIEFDSPINMQDTYIIEEDPTDLLR